MDSTDTGDHVIKFTALSDMGGSPPPTIQLHSLFSMDSFPVDHFLSLPRPDANIGPVGGAIDTTTLAAHDFDVDTKSGFMPPEPPLSRLPEQWEIWEATLDQAIVKKLQLGDKFGLTNEEIIKSESWRVRLRDIPILDTSDLAKSEILLRRAHHVLSWNMHFYIHSMPPSNDDIIIPKGLSIPLLRICAQLHLPPVLTYSDDVLYNWTFRDPNIRMGTGEIALDNLRTQTLFTGTRDEEEFYLTSARIELRGVEALTIISTVMDEIFVGDEIALRRVTGQLDKLACVIRELREILLSVKGSCDPMVFYRDIRPWFRGVDSLKTNQRWIFEGLEDQPDLQEPKELSGPSAGQSSLVHTLDIFLGVDRYSHSSLMTGKVSLSESSAIDVSQSSPPSFLTRMQAYMPRHHRAFLTHMSTNPRPLRDYVFSANNAALSESYNKAVTSLKEFRDAHFQVVALYIIGPAHRLKQMEARSQQSQSPWKSAASQCRQPLKGTGGTDLAKFLKGVRDQTVGALLTQPQN